MRVIAAQHVFTNIMPSTLTGTKSSYLAAIIYTLRDIIKKKKSKLPECTNNKKHSALQIQSGERLFMAHSALKEGIRRRQLGHS